MHFAAAAKKEVYELTQRQKRIADVGLELEIEGLALPPNVPHWQAKAEGSLQNGVEYITKPIKLDAVRLYVDSLRKYIADMDGVVKPSYRCSTHVHVNVGTGTVADMLGFVVVFTLFEPLLLALCGPQRNGNLFCMSNYDTGDAISAFHLLCNRIERTASGYPFQYERGKYSALNLGRLADLNTVEARCFPLSVDGAEIEKWCKWLLRMKDIAKAQTDKTYREFWKLVRQNPMWYANAIFETAHFSIPNASSLIDAGAETAYEYTKILKQYYAKVEKPKAEAKKKTLSDYVIDDIQPEVEFE